MVARDFRRFNGRLGTVVADSFDWAAFHRFLAQPFFVRVLRLFVYVRMAAIVVPFKIGRRGFTAQVAIDALIIDVKFSRYVLGVFVGDVSHTFLS
jgi:hypothetical protein